MRCSKAVPGRKMGHSAFLVSALVLSSPTVPPPTFHFLSAVVAELPLLWNILWTPNSSSLDYHPWNGNGGFRQLCQVSADSSGMRACSLERPCLLTTLVWPITVIFFPNETELRKPPNSFYKQAAMAYHPFSTAWSGLVRAACMNKNSTVLHGRDSEAKIQI